MSFTAVKKIRVVIKQIRLKLVYAFLMNLCVIAFNELQLYGNVLYYYHGFINIVQTGEGRR